MNKLALVEEVTVRLQRGENPSGFAEDLEVFLKDPTRWRKTDSGLVVPARGDETGKRDVYRAWMRDVYRELGLGCVVPPVPALTPEQTKSLLCFGFRLFYVPPIGEDAYPASFVKPDWGRRLDANQIERRPLPGKWAAVETIAKPGSPERAGYLKDRLTAAVKLYCRFNVSWDDLHSGGLLAKIAGVTSFPEKGVRLPTVEEWNFLANLLNWLHENRGETLPDLGATDSWEWCENAYESDGRLIAGDRGHGGLAGVYRDWCRGEDHDVGFRVLAVL